jgi:hypothetical protein
MAAKEELRTKVKDKISSTFGDQNMSKILAGFEM